MNFKSRIEKLDLTRLEDFKEFKNFYSIACKNQDHVENRNIREKLNNTLTWFPITGLQEFPEGWINKDIADMEDLQELENYYLALSGRVTEDYLRKLPMNSVKVIYSYKDNDKSMFYQGNISGLTTAMSLLDSKSEEYKQLEQTRVTYEELDNNITEKYVKQHLNLEKATEYLKSNCTLEQDGITYIVTRVEENGDVIIFDIYDKQQKESVLKGEYLLTGMPLSQ